MTKEVNTTGGASKNKSDQAELIKGATVEGLKELAQLFGIAESKIPEDATKEQLVELLLAANRHEIAVAQVVRVQDGANITEKECPPGHMIIKVTPKSGEGWGPKSKDYFFFAVQGDVLVGKRGQVHVVKDKFRSAWRDSVRFEYETMDAPRIGSDGRPTAAATKKTEVPAEDVIEYHWNRDLEAEAAVEKDLIEGSKRYMEDKRAEKALRSAANLLAR